VILFHSRRQADKVSTSGVRHSAVGISRRHWPSAYWWI